MNDTKAWQGVAVIAVLVLFDACATLRPTHPDDTPGATIRKPAASLLESPDAPSPSSTSSILTDKAPSQPLGLQECIMVALENNPEVASAWWNSEAALAEKRAQAGKRWPNVHFAGSYFHYQDDQRLVAPSNLQDATYFSDDLVAGDLVLRLPLYAGGRFVNEVRAAELLAQSAEHTLARTREELVFNVTSTYFAILVQRRLIESIDFSRQTLQEHLTHVENLIEAQRAVKVDRYRTEVRLATIVQQRIQEKNVLEIQRHSLLNLMGISEEGTAALRISGDLSLPEITNTDTSIALALGRREDYAAAQAALDAQARRVDSVRGARAPQVYLEASYGGRWGPGGSGEPVSQPSRSYAYTSGGQSSASFTNTVPVPGGGSVATTLADSGAVTTRFSKPGVGSADDFEDLGRIGVNVDIPLFEGGTRRAEITREQAKLAAARQQLRKLELQIRLEVKTATLNLDAARERVAVTGTSITEAEESLRVERDKYDAGRGTIVDVLDAQAALLETQTAYYRALADVNVAQAYLALVTGDQR